MATSSPSIYRDLHGQTYPIDNFTLPFITICIKNRFKPTVLNKYGLDSWVDFVFGTFEDNKWKQENISIWDTYVETSYLLKRDLEIQIQDPWSPIQFSVGKNYINCENIRYLKGGEVCKNGSNILIDIKEYFTMVSGTCYGLKSKKPEKSNIRPDPNFSGIQNSVSEKPDHDMGQTCPVRPRTSDISGILGLPEIRKPFVDTLVQVIQFLRQGVKKGEETYKRINFP